MKQRIFILIIISLLCVYDVSATTRYVKQTAAGLADGSSWANASSDLQLMIDQSGTGDEVHVAGGNYVPTRLASNTATVSINNRGNSFVMKSGVNIYGGYLGTGIFANLRLPQYYVTALDGDIGTLNDSTDNTYHVVIAPGIINAVLDGFTIQNGNANNNSTTISVNANVIENKHGSGIYVAAANVSINNCSIDKNHTNEGGAIYVLYSTALLLNSAITNNTGDTCAAIYQLGNGSLEINRCKISGNTATKNVVYLRSQGANIRIVNSLITGNKITTASLTPSGQGYPGFINNNAYTSNDTLKIVNCTIAGNSHNANYVYIIAQNNGITAVQNSIITGNTGTGFAYSAYCTYNHCMGLSTFYSGAGTANNTSVDPGFVYEPSYTTAPFTNGDYHIQYCSPAINAGDSSYIAANELYDLDIRPRISDGNIDVGAYEYQISTIVPDANGIVYVNGNVGGGANGNSWTNAIPKLADALKAAKYDTGIHQIWVTSGTYYPMYTADSMICNTADNRKKSFVMQSNLSVYGGFTGTETAINQRSATTAATILDGDIGVPNNTADNAYHVVLSSGAANVVLDDVTIQNGNANNGGVLIIGSHTFSQSDGSAINILGGSFNMTNCTVKNNLCTGSSAIKYGEASGNIENCTVINNFGGTDAALTISSYAGIAIRNSLFAGNKAMARIVNILGNSVTARFYNCVFSGNELTLNYGLSSTPGLIEVQTSNYVGLPGTDIVNCVFSGNKHNPSYTKIISLNSFGVGNPTSPFNVQNSIVWGNADQTNPLSAPGNNFSVNNSIVQGGVATATGSANNLNTDPSFVNAPSYTTAPFTTGDYHITRCSPAFNTGMNSFLSATDTTDFDGYKRIATATVDMGAYEYQMGTPDANGIVYVDSSAATNGNGSSWATAIPELADALKAAKYDTSIHGIYVATGTYKPLYTADSLLCNTIDNRKKSFVIPDGVMVMGGYNNGAITYTNGYPQNPSILSGDIGVANNDNDNAYHVVIAAGTNSPNTKLYNFIVEKGRTDFYIGSMTVNGISISGVAGSGMANQANVQGSTANKGADILYCTFRNNSGFYGALSNFFCNNTLVFGTKIINDSSAYGGMANIGPGTVNIDHSKISGNKALYYGGGIYGNRCKLNIHNSLITGNYSYNDGGGIHADSCTVFIGNCTIASNKAIYNFGGFNHYHASGAPVATITNSIIWGNNSSVFYNIDTTYNPLLLVNNSIVMGQTYSFGTNMIQMTPDFINPIYSFNAPSDAGDYHLYTCSPAINAGSNSNFISPYISDLDGNLRINQGRIDLGAYENSGYSITQTPGDSLVNTNFANSCNYSEFVFPNTTLPPWQNFPGASGKLFMSIKQPTTAPINGTVVPVNFSSKLRSQYGTGTTLQLNNPFGQTGYYYPMNRTWAATINGSLSAPVSVRFYFDNADSADIATQYNFGNLQNLIVYKVNGTDPYNTSATGYKEYSYAATPDTNHFTIGSYQGIRYVEFVVTSFSSGSIALKTNNPLSIKLDNIAAKNMGQKNRIDWNTLREDAGDEFVLERSSNGKEFTNLAVIAAKGNASSYSYWDEAPFSGMNYYRLKMKDMNNYIHYSNIVSAFVNDKNAFAIEAFPNPVSDQLNIRIYGAVKQAVQISICDVTGKEVWKLSVANAMQTIDMSNWSTGIYFLKYSDADKKQTVKIVKQ